MTARINYETDTAVHLDWSHNRPPADLPDNLRRRVLRSKTLGVNPVGMTVRAVVNRINGLYAQYGYHLGPRLYMRREVVSGYRWRWKMEPGDRLIVLGCGPI